MIATTLHGRLTFGILPSLALDITFGADARTIDATVEISNIPSRPDYAALCRHGEADTGA